MSAPAELADTIERFPAVLRAFLEPIPAEWLRLRPAEGEWNALEVILHLTETEGPAFRDRIAAIVDGDAEIAPFDPSLPRDPSNEPLAELLATFAAERATSAAYRRSLTPADLEQRASLEPHGEFAAGDFAHEWPFHDHDHLAQIAAAVNLGCLEHMGDTMRRALGS